MLWSPDGKTISDASLGEACGGLLDVASGVERMSFGGPNGCLVTQVGAWSPDGKALAVVGPAGDVELLSFPDGAVMTKSPSRAF